MLLDISTDQSDSPRLGFAFSAPEAAAGFQFQGMLALSPAIGGQEQGWGDRSTQEREWLSVPTWKVPWQPGSSDLDYLDLISLSSFAYSVMAAYREYVVPDFLSSSVATATGAFYAPLTNSYMRPIFSECAEALPTAVTCNVCWQVASISRVAFRNPAAVVAFLERHQEIEPFLALALPALTKCFDAPIEVDLEVMSYAYATAYDELVGWIQSTDDVATGMKKLDRFEEEWFLDHMDMVHNKFNFNIEFG